MKRRIANLFGITIMALAVSFSLIQLRIPVARAQGCPEASEVGCGCMFMGGTSVSGGGLTIWYCDYLCGGCGGGGNEMMIETMVTVTVVE
jgi:hypothetical protein